MVPVQAGTVGTCGTVGTVQAGTSWYLRYRRYLRRYQYQVSSRLLRQPELYRVATSLIVCCASDTRAITFDYGGCLIYYHRNRRRDLELRLPKTKRRNLAVPYYSIFFKIIELMRRRARRDPHRLKIP